MSTEKIEWKPCLNCACAVDPSQWTKHNNNCLGMREIKRDRLDRMMEAEISDRSYYDKDGD